MTTKVLSLLALLLAALLAIALLRDEPSEPPPAGAAVAAKSVAPEPEAPAAELDAPEPAAARREQLASAPATEAPPALPTADEAETPEPIRGSIVLLAEGGERIEGASGTVGISVWSERSGRNREVEVVDGRFTIEAPRVPAAEARLEFGSGILNGRSVVAAEPAEGLPERTGITEDGRFLLECVHRGAIELDVRDARTDALLDAVDVAAGDWTTTYPGSNPELLVEGVASPVRVDLERLEDLRRFGRGGTWLIGGAGYAWKSVPVDARGDRQVVRLERAGSVAVEVIGLGLAKGLQLFVATPEHGMRYERPVRKDGTYRLERWPLGPVQASVQRGDWFSQPKVFGSASGEVTEGEQLALRIEVDAEAAAPSREAELELELLVPAGWAIDQLGLSMKLEVSPTGVEARLNERAGPEVEPWGEGGQRFLFDLGPQPVGTWIAQTRPGQWRSVIELEQSGRQQLILPAPADVTVLAIDPDSGAPIQNASVHWYCTLDGPTGGWSMETATALPEPGHHEFRAPATEIVIQASHEDYGETRRTVKLLPGAQSVELELLPLVGFELKLMQGDSQVALEGWDWMPDLHAPGSEETLFGAKRSVREGNILYWLEAPGLVELRFPELEGYAPIPPLELDLQPGELQPVEVQVVSVR